MTNKQYPEYISSKRIPVPAPEKLVVDGQAIFGTFDSEIPCLNLLDLDNNKHSKNLKNLSEWEAFEISFKEITVLTALYNTGPIGFSIVVVYDKELKKVTHSWKKFSSRKNAKIAENLINGTSEQNVGDDYYVLKNDFKNGKASLRARLSNKKYGTVEIDVRINNVSDPSCVSIPFGKNLPLYSQKNLFTAEGKIILAGKEYVSDETSVAIIDDHKGYYPKLSHYDWLTTMDIREIDGKMRTFGFNLTRNQSINQDDYNENLIWVDGESFPLPPVVFSQDMDDSNIWYIKDEYGKVDIVFEIGDTYKMEINALGLLIIKYYLPFGTITGKVVDTNGKEYIVDGMMGIGEDKTVKMPFGPVGGPDN